MDSDPGGEMLKLLGRWRAARKAAIQVEIQRIKGLIEGLDAPSLRGSGPDGQEPSPVEEEERVQAS